VEEGWTRAVVALGTNQGDRESVLADARADLRATEGVVVIAQSSVVETVALTESGYDSAEPQYLNQVVVIHTAWPAKDLLDRLHDIEQRHGRVRDGVRYAPRTLDLDLIVWGELVGTNPELTLPHPRAHERRFVLEPWLEIEPDAVFPGRGLVRDLLPGAE
jgi:2-amino-4-hydroxy-6-hydroxymethyldihydropteridine diphosphokinase